MFRSRGGMASPLHLVPLLLSIITLCTAGPLGPLPNVTSADLGLKEGSCALGDVVYMPGDEFPGSSPCERCVCAGGGVQCEKQICESRPGCKALHRPDHCCPTYQCECEQEGRIYSNGEKLVDPADPCRVCYCQGGEVVCRRIACFVRDDCTPRLVPGRCCPEYDNCPLRGVTSLPGASSSISSVSESIEVPSPPPKENIKQEITIKEITPVSEIPVITDVKIKEILPVPTDVAEYSSSKSPLIPREATSEKNLKESDSKTESPSVIEIHSSLPFIASSPETVQFAATENKEIDLPPSKISFSTQDSINSAIYPSNVPLVATMGIPLVSVEPSSVATTKSPIMEEDDTFDHNPAFPPLPDDLSVLRNHEDEIVPEPAVDSDHVSNHDILTSVNPLSLSTESEVKRPVDTQPDLKETLTTTPKDLPDTTVITTTLYNKFPSTTAFPEIILTSEAPTFKESPMINLRSAIPTEILNVPSLIPDEVESGNEGVSTTAEEITTMQPTTTTTTVQPTTVTTELPIKLDEITTPSKIEVMTTERKKYEGSTTDKTSEEFVVTTERTETSFAATSSTEVPTATTENDIVTSKTSESETEVSTKEQEPEITTSIVKSNVATEFTSQTELSSLPIETSDQNPPEVSENTTNDKTDQSTTTDSSEISTKVPPTTSEIITVSRSVPNEITGFENVETTEFILTSFGSSETATDAVELIKISAEPEKSAAIIESDSKKNNVLNDLISLISDVASIGNHTDEQKTEQSLITTTTSISESEELIPVNAGYKSKNKNFNQNSITEVPFKSKIPNQGNKQKVVEIEDDESESVTDSVPPNDKVEPTTRRPLIDNVTDDMVGNKTDKTDIEIIRKSYVPTISRRPTKVVMKKSEIAASDESSAFSASAESSTDSRISEETAQTTVGTSTAVTEPPRTDAAPLLTDAQ